MHIKENSPLGEAAACLPWEEIGFERLSAYALAFAAFLRFFCLSCEIGGIMLSTENSEAQEIAVVHAIRVLFSRAK